MRPRRVHLMRLDPLRFDRLLALVLAAASAMQLMAANPQHRLEAGLMSLALCGLVAIRRPHPVAAGIAGQSITVVEFAIWGGFEVIPASVAWICLAYALAVWTARSAFLASLAFIVATDLAAAAGPGSLRAVVPVIVVTVVVMVLVRWVVGDRERRAELAERERDVAAREAVVEERARIARELHDAIAHHVSMIVVQAGAERRALDQSQEGTRDVLQTIEQTGRGALVEMRRLLGMLREDGSDPLAPQPGLSDVPMLVGQLREAGLQVQLDIAGERRELPVGVDLSAYRIVQEALTNALKHAGDARVEVLVRYAADSLELEIADDGSGASLEAAVPRGGHGLVGMRERVALYGGRLRASPNPGGGFTVHVLLPTR